MKKNLVRKTEKKMVGEMTREEALKFLPVLEKKLKDGTVGRILTANTDAGTWFNVELILDTPVMKAERAVKRANARESKREEMRKKILPLIIFDKKTKKPMPKQANYIAAKTGYPTTAVAAFIAHVTMGSYK